MKGLLFLLPLLGCVQNVHVAMSYPERIHFPTSAVVDNPRSHANKPDPEVAAVQSDIQKIVTEFSWDLFRNSKLPNDLDNFVLSPVMIQVLLSILMRASDGETLSQLQTVVGNLNVQNLLQLMNNNPGRSHIQLETATGIFVDTNDKLNQTFTNQAKKLNVDVLRVQFQQGDAAKAAINQWASETTHGLIPQMFNDAYDIKGLKLALTSAIYFHSTWKYKFSSMNPQIFYSANNVRKQVEFMQLHHELIGDSFTLDNGLTGIFIEIPYMNDAYSMIIMLPDPQFTLDSLTRSMKSDQLKNLWNVLEQEGKRGITLRMPKFNISSHFSVTNALLKMGLVDLFTINSRLPYLIQRQEMRVSDIVQQSVMEVNENGTTAAAATVALLIPLSADGVQEQVLTIDRPFLAMIYDKNAKIPLFISKVYNP